MWPPLRLIRLCLEHASVGVVRPLRSRIGKGGHMRFVGLDVHRDFCEVAMAEGGSVRCVGRVDTTPAELERFAQGLSATDEVALENTGIAASIVRILEPHVARVAVANPMAVRAIAWAKVKTDKVDACTLAILLASGFLPSVWVGDEGTRALRRLVCRRAGYVRARTRAKNEIHAVLQRNLSARPPASDLFGRRGRAWLAGLLLPADERDAVEAFLRQVDFFDAEVSAAERELARRCINCAAVHRLVTIPGVDMVTAATLMAAIGEISRFPTSRHLVGYLGLDPRVRQSGPAPARHGRISKEGSSQARRVLVEAAWTVQRTPGPLRAFAERIRSRRGANVATVAVARKLAVLCWHLLTKSQDYAFARPSLVRTKLRRIELQAERPAGRHPSSGSRLSRQDRSKLELDVAQHGEEAYRRLVADRTSSSRASAGAATGARIS